MDDRVAELERKQAEARQAFELKAQADIDEWQKRIDELEQRKLTETQGWHRPIDLQLDYVKHQLRVAEQTASLGRIALHERQDFNKRQLLCELEVEKFDRIKAERAKAEVGPSDLSFCERVRMAIAILRGGV